MATTASHTKHRLARVLETQVNESDTSQYEVGEQRERNHRYYSLEKLGNEMRGHSHYISPDVIDAVEAKKAVFSETFLSTRQALKFSTCPVPGEAEAKTEYVMRTLRKNRYERLFKDGWHDAFVAKRMVVYAPWTEEVKENELDIQQMPLEVLEQQLSQVQNVVDVDYSRLQVQTLPGIRGPMNIASGQLTVSTMGGYTELRLIQPERYYRDPDVAYGEEGQWQTIEEDLSRGQLIEDGYDPDQVDRLSTDYRFRSEEEDAARKRHDSSWTRRRQHNRTDEQETVSFYTTFTWLTYDDSNFAELDLDFEPPENYALYKIHWTPGEVLLRADGYHAVELVKSSNIFEWCEMKISHAENGLCTADVEAHTQKTSSVLKRLVVDNQTRVNATRYVALRNGIVDMQEFRDNKVGAVATVKRMDAVAEMPTPQLSPLTFNAIQMLKQDGESRSGISGLAKGMNTDALRYQNADNMVERLTTAGQRRVTMAARDFAAWLADLYEHIVQQGMEYDTSQEAMEWGGKTIPIAPQNWQDTEFKVDIATALTPEEGQALGNALIQMNSMWSQDPAMAMMYGAQQRHALWDTVLQYLGFGDSSPFLLSPESGEYKHKEVQARQTQMIESKKNEQLVGLQAQGLVSQIQSTKNRDQLGFMELDWKRTNDMADNLREDEKLDHEKWKDQEEVRLEETQNRQVGLS